VRLETALPINDSFQVSHQVRFEKFPFLRCLHGGQVILFGTLSVRVIQFFWASFDLDAQGGDGTVHLFQSFHGLGVYSSVHSFDCSSSLLYDAAPSPWSGWLSLEWLVDTPSRRWSLLSLLMTSFGHVTRLGASGPSSYQAKTRRPRLAVEYTNQASQSSLAFLPRGSPSGRLTYCWIT
jgi:hypothetical protein